MFIIKWVTHSSEIVPTETGDRFDVDLDELVSSCLKRLPVMRMKPLGLAPDGFLIFDESHYEVRRWFGSPQPKKASPVQIKNKVVVIKNEMPP